MNALLCSYLSAHAAEDTLFVLWGFSPEDAGLPRPSLDALLQQRLSRYLSSLLQQTPCVITAEEFALHADTLAQEFPHIILVQNTCYRTLLPVSVTLTPEMQSGLLSHFDPAAPQDTPLPGIEPCLRVYSNLLCTEEGIACCIPLDDLLRQYPQVERVSLGAAPQTVPDADAGRSAFALTGEADYFCLVQRLQRGEALCVSADSFIGDEAGLADSLAALAGAFPGQLSRAHAQTMQPERPVCPEARTLLQQHWGYPDFLPLDVYDLDALHRGEKKLRTITQEDIIDDLIQQAELCREGQTYRDLFVTASTGAGKSVMFQIPAIDLAEKYGMVTLVISPLIGLMNDQVQGMEKHRYAKARTINSDIPPMVKKTIAQEVQEGRCDILYLSPESLLSRSDISDLIGDRAIGLLIVDEAHIVTTWGKQFRPDYWFLGDYVNKLRKKQLNGPHHHAFVTATFTATATYGGEEDMYRETLRSRSFFLELLMEHYLDELLTGCGVSRANLIYSGGGHCYALLPNTPAVLQTVAQWNRSFNGWLRQEFGTQLFLANAWTACSGNALTNTPAEKSPYKELFRRVNRLLEQHKFHRYTVDDLRQLNSTVAYPDGRECKVCGTSANLKDDLCPWCRLFVDLSIKIQKKNVLVVSRQASDADDCALPARDGSSEYLSLTDPVSARKRLISGEPIVRVYTKNAPFTGLTYSTNLYVGDYAASNSMEELADQSQGVRRIAVCRMDVDNLGHAFISGFEQENEADPVKRMHYVTLSRTSAFSRQMSLFFKCYINSILEGLQVSIVYAGGDITTATAETAAVPAAITAVAAMGSRMNCRRRSRRKRCRKIM